MAKLLWGLSHKSNFYFHVVTGDVTSISTICSGSNISLVDIGK